MAGSVILRSPVLLLGLGLAVLLCLLDGRVRRSRGALTVLSAAVGILTVSLAMVAGASPAEAVCALLALLLLTLSSFRKEGGS